MRANRPHGNDGAVVFRGDKFVQSDPSMKYSYGPLLREIVKFFQTGIPPVAPEECVEVLAFMQAADVSKEKGGAPARLDELK